MCRGVELELNVLHSWHSTSKSSMSYSHSGSTGRDVLVVQQDARKQRGGHSQDAFRLLLEASAPSAFHDTSGRAHNRTKPSTSPPPAVLRKIMEWVFREDPAMADACIMWLRGPAGSGKTAIAQCISELCHNKDLLLATFFFSQKDSRRNDSQHLVATLAYQVASLFPEVKKAVISAIDNDPLIFSRSLETQLLSLIVKPLSPRVKSGYFDDLKVSRRVIVIDGIDECSDPAQQISILKSMGNMFQAHRVPLFLLICSRPEHETAAVFNVGSVKERISISPSEESSKTKSPSISSGYSTIPPSISTIPPSSGMLPYRPEFRSFDQAQTWPTTPWAAGSTVN